jgi:glycerol-3-phosphate cytidylyltransferase-like family protein
MKNQKKILKKGRPMNNLAEVLNQGSMRDHVQEAAKKFKTSWVDLGRALYAVWKDKLYREWGYQTFDGYVTKEIHIRKLTAMKLLRSYFFLEKEEPQYLKQEDSDDEENEVVPSFETIDVLRQAKNKDIDGSDYRRLKEQVFLKGKDAKEVRKDLTTMMRQREELDPKEAREKQSQTQLKRLVSTLKSLKREVESSKIVPASLIRDLTRLIDKLDVELK